LQHKGANTNITLQSSYQNNYRYYDNTLDADFSQFSIIGIFNNYGQSYNNVKAFTNELRIQSADVKKQQIKMVHWIVSIHQ